MRYKLGSGPKHSMGKKNAGKNCRNLGYAVDTLDHIGITTLTSSRRFDFLFLLITFLFGFFVPIPWFHACLALLLRARKLPAVPLGRAHD